MRHSNTRLEHASESDPSVQAFAPGRVNLIGEHTDYNDGLCLPFAIEQGITVRARPAPEPSVEEDVLVRGTAEELRRAGIRLQPCELEISGNLARGAGLSSSAAVCVAVALALCAVSGQDPPGRIELARLCSRVENDWMGAQTGLLDQLAVLSGEVGKAVLIDMRGPQLTPIPLDLDDHVLALLDSGASRNLAESGYNQRREECRAACEALGVDSLRDASSAEGLPDPLDRRVHHVLTENERVTAAVDALERRDLTELGRLLEASHRSLRDDYDVSTPEVERAVETCKQAGALGARIMGGGFGGSVLALFGPGAALPAGAVAVAPGPGARVW
jgi:galactokinase